MINYYVLLDKLADINNLKEMDEEKLRATLRKISKKLRQKSEKLTGKDAVLISTLDFICRRFLTTLDHYGSKENYDRALAKSTKIIKVKVPDKKKLGKFVLVTGLIGTMAIGLPAVTLTKTEVPLYPHETYEEVEKELRNNGIDTVKINENGAVLEVVTPRWEKDKVDKLNEKREDESYSFSYIIKEGDTFDELSEKFKILMLSKEDGTMDLREGDVVTIITKDAASARLGREIYEKDQENKVLEPTYFVSYTVKKGDTLGELALRFGVTCHAIGRYNESLIPEGEKASPGEVIYEGFSYLIPQYEEIDKNKTSVTINGEEYEVIQPKVNTK